VKRKPAPGAKLSSDTPKPDWWQATDGKWYPPWAAADYKAPVRKAGPNWRPMTWVIVVVDVLFAIWIVSALANNSCSDATYKNACDTGTAIGVGIILFLAAVVNAILGVLWMVTRKTKRTCPVCGTEVAVGLVTCGACGHDYRQAAT